MTENYSIWIDYNHDNDFTDAGEQVVNFASDLGGYIVGSSGLPLCRKWKGVFNVADAAKLTSNRCLAILANTLWPQRKGW